MQPIQRRQFLKQSAATVGAASVAAGLQTKAFAQASDTVRVGVIGCGGRGRGAARNAVEGSEGVVIQAIAELTEDRLNDAFNSVNGIGEASRVDRENDCYLGLGAYKQLLDRDDIDMVILATPPVFRPYHLEAAIAAGKHVFMEKPVAVCPDGIRKVIAASRAAKQQGLGIVCGTQRRHQQSYLDAMDAIHNGAIGEVLSANVYWQQGGLWVRSLQEKEQQGWSDTEWMLRNWLYFTWTSGDHIVEQHVHNLDVALWAMQDQTPVKFYANGGRQERTAPDYGNVFDHFSVEVEMPNGVRIISKCRQIPNCSNRVTEHIVGTEGYADLGGRCNLRSWSGERINGFDGGGAPSPYVVEHTNLVASIRAGEPLNEGERIAQSTLTAILGREAAYSGKEIDYNWALTESKLKLFPGEDGDDLDMAAARATPPVAIPGQYEMI